MHLLALHLLNSVHFLIGGTPAPQGASEIIAGSAGQACSTSCGGTSLTTVFANITHTLLIVIGSISVIMIIVGGLRYVLSNGDSKSAESARNTILYAVIGVVISISAYAIVSFVTTAFK